MEISAGKGVHFACDSAQRETARHIRRQIDLKDLVAQVLTQRRAHGSILGQDKNAFVLLAQTQFKLGTDHAARFDAANLCLFQLLVWAGPLVGIGVEQERALAGEGDF